MIKYLREFEHPKAISMSRCKVNKWRLKWKTIYNGVDCGIFVMRHMETFKGEQQAKYDCGLVSESIPQKTQLDTLRVKYLGKMLLSDRNLQKQFVIKEAEKFHKLEENERKKIIEVASLTKEERFSKMWSA